ncbi:MAG: NAD-dependent protein deacylase [Bacilli bacterium]|jgi:NAD-dependent deacetylase|nr:NAD-dependent protein deacylase [Bacilli bacterium]
MLNKEKIEQLQKWIDEAKHIVFFGGAGVSTESGIPDFRSATGLYTNNLSAEEIVSHEYFFQDPDGFYDFYKNKMMYLDAKPNACHRKLAELEKHGKDITIVTQNIDGLHQMAGSSKVLELHGTIYKNRCLSCGKSFSAKYVKEAEGVPHCDDCGGLVKPEVVLYGEALDEEVINKTILALKQADLLIVGGTSLKVYPAASFIDFYQGQRKVFINLNDNPLRDYFYIDAKIGEVFSLIKTK